MSGQGILEYMPRPARPLLNRDLVVAAAIRIIDSEGLAACSLPRLAREFGVRAPSLYHHFADRAEIMAEVAKAIVRETVVPRKRSHDGWVEWFVQLALNFRRSILRHPNAAPVLLEFVPRDVLGVLYDDAARYLTDLGVAPELHVLILDGLETLTLGASLTQAMKEPATRAKIFPSVDASTEPNLAAAVDANTWSSSSELFAQTIRVFLTGTALLGAPPSGERSVAPEPRRSPNGVPQPQPQAMR